MSTLKPLNKGAHLVLNQELLSWVQDTLAIINDAYTDEQNDEDPTVIIKKLVADQGFEIDRDSFGLKAYLATSYYINEHDPGELRITIVLPKRTQVLMLDIRPWGNY
jgi:hypothetical protein